MGSCTEQVQVGRMCVGQPGPIRICNIKQGCSGPSENNINGLLSGD